MALRQSMQRVSRGTKLNRLAGSMAIKIAKEKNDPMYRKVIKFKGLWKKWSAKLMQKYGQKGKQAARKAALKSMHEAEEAGIQFDTWDDLFELSDDIVWTDQSMADNTKETISADDYI